MVPDTSLKTLNHLLITLIVNYGVHCKFAINDNNKKKNRRCVPRRGVILTTNEFISSVISCQFAVVS
jgi:hypothetical protein